MTVGVWYMTGCQGGMYETCVVRLMYLFSRVF